MNPMLGMVATALFLAAGALPAEDPAPADAAYPGTLTLAVDATDLDHRVFRVREAIPVAAGRLTLFYPEWLPGNHEPSGPIDKLAGLSFSVDGKALPWSRDSSDVYAFHVDVPDGATTLVAEFMYLSPNDRSQGRVVMTPDMLNLQWNAVVLYPSGHDVARIEVSASVKLPSGWSFATALETAGAPAADGSVAFRSASLETLVDSPLMAGRHFKRVDLDPGAKVPVRLDIFADEDRYLDITPDQIKAHRALVQQAYKLFDSRHYDHYDFLFALSDQLSRIGLEHHRSSEDGVAPGYFSEWDRKAGGRDLLAHEFTHSWNGKFRRPADLATPNYNVPMGDSLLWVYEGQTQYWGYVLAARSGLWTQNQARDALALVASRYADDRPGLSWRNVQDTTNDPVAAKRRPLPYKNYQLSEDYYSAGLLIWLAVDAKLRSLTRDSRSLDDFARAFFGVDDGSWRVKTYTFDDVVAALDKVASYDWTKFLRERLDAHAPPLDGFAPSGWRLVYRDQPSAYQKAAEADGKTIDDEASIGLLLSSKDGRITDVRWNGPAFKAGIGSGGRVIAVQGREFTAERLQDAIASSARGVPVELLVKDGDTYRTHRLDYRGGLRYPHLERLEGEPDRLSEILAARR
jgi:predicted metalloprotease with PDZ domain